MTETFVRACRVNAPLLLWLGVGLLLICFGFALDGASEVGHHAGFILGGVAVGGGVASARRR